MESAGSDRPTVATIASHAGVSTASVSRVLNGQGGRPDTVRRVLASASALGYVPNSVARSLKVRRTNQITFAMADIGNPVYVAMVRQIQQVARQEGYRLLLHSTDADPADEVDVLRGLADRHVDGLIISPLRITADHLAELSRVAGPVVVIGSLPDDVAVDNVRADSRAGAVLAVAHLAAAGRGRIGLVNGPTDTVPGAARDRGYREGLAGVGLPPRADLVEVGDFDRVAGYGATRRLLDRVPDLDALLCANDLIAAGALHALREAGRRVPEDVAVVGMDDSEIARAVWPTLTSVCLGSEERGRLAARLLLDRLGDGGDALAPRRPVVAPRLVVRESSR